MIMGLMMVAMTTKEHPMPELDDDLFDESAGYEDDTGIRLTKGLSVQERKQATKLYRYFNDLWGLCIIRGEPGAGKDTFLNWFLSTCKRYYPGKRILRDEKPRLLFGKYDGLFNEEQIKDDLTQMRAVAKGVAISQLDAVLEKAADKWAKSERAKVLLQDSVVGLTEYWKYVYNREHNTPMNKTMGGIHKMGRHFNTLIVGCTQLESDLDKKTCKPFINWRVTCTRSQKDTTRYTFITEKVKYDRRMDLIIPIARPFVIHIDAGKPLPYIGDGKVVVKKPDYRPETTEEQVIINVLKARNVLLSDKGIDVSDYATLVAFLETMGVMTEHEILYTLKELCLKLPGKRPKFVLWYPCIYHTFNSRSAPNLKTNIKVGD